MIERGRRRYSSHGPADRPEVARVQASILSLEMKHPELSARKLLSRGTRTTLIVLLAALIAGLVFAPIGTLVVLLAIVTSVYLATMLYKLWLYYESGRGDPVFRVSDDEARAVDDAMLPVYTVLVPVFREPESVGQLLTALEALEYPRDRLDVKLLLEADDVPTLLATEDAHPGHYVEVVEVPPATPRTKPKALDYGLLGARGELVTIFDAEDIPEPLQLRRAAVAFDRAGPSMACLQARLGFYNSRQNLITRWFTLEYAMWFRDFLPGIVRAGAPVPLGGTSNHFRRGALIAAGGWDAFNVTEDADLGVRLARLGQSVGLLDSETQEEATSDFLNWVKQRSRWYKGYLQTWLVHLRKPRKLWRDLGPKGFVGFNLLVGGTPLLAVCNVFTWTLTLVWLVLRPGWVDQLFPAWIYYVGLFCFVVGNSIVIYLGLLSARLDGNHDLLLYALFMPIYWLMMALAAFKGALQLALAPSFWEKTVHGMAPESIIDLTRTEIDLREEADSVPGPDRLGRAST